MDKITEIRIEQIFDEESDQNYFGFTIIKMVKLKYWVSLLSSHNATNKL